MNAGMLMRINAQAIRKSTRPSAIIIFDDAFTGILQFIKLPRGSRPPECGTDDDCEDKRQRDQDEQRLH